MAKRDKSLSVRFLVWWTFGVGAAIAVCAFGYYAWQVRTQQELLKKETYTLAAVLAPRVSHDVQNHVAGYAHRTLRAVQGSERNMSLSMYGPDGGILFSTNPVFRRSKEVPSEVSQVIADQQPRWVYSAAENRCQAYYPIFGGGKVSGVIHIAREAPDLLLIPLADTALLVLVCSFIAVLASGFLLLFLRRHYFKPLKELSTMIETVNKPIHAATVLEIPESEFHGELASLYRNAGDLARKLAEAKKALENRVEVRSAVEKIQDETQFLARQIYERRIDQPATFAGYEILAKPIQMEKWGKLWKNAAAQGPRKIIFSFWNSKNDGLRAVLQGFQWDEIFQQLAQGGKSLDEISDELFMEFGLDLGEWLLGQWDAYDRRLELLGNVSACHWDQSREMFSFLRNGKPLSGSRKQGFWVNWSFGPGDKLVVFNSEAFESPGGGGLDAFMGLLSINIKSTPQNLLDLLVREVEEGKTLAPGASLLLMVHAPGPIAAADANTVVKKSVGAQDPVAR